MYDTDYYFYVIKFFTTWAVIIIIFHTFTHKYINLLLLAVIVFFGGMYVSYINPRTYFFEFKGEDYNITSPWLRFFAIDTPCHILLLVITVYLYGNNHPKFISLQTLAVFILLLVYILIYDVQDIYKIDEMQMYSVVFCGVLIYVLVFRV